MKKRKLHFLKLGMLFFGISLLLLNCIDENSIGLDQNDVIEQVNDFQPIEIEEAKNLLNSIVTKNKKHSKKNGFSVTIDKKSLHFNEVKNTYLSIPTFSASIKSDIHSTVFMVKKQGVIYPCLYNYIPNKNNSSEGTIIVSTIDGEFINGYKVVNDVFVSQYKLKTNSKNAAKTYAKRISTQYWWDLGELDAIEITRKGAGGGKSSLYFNTNYHPVSSQGWMSLNLAGGRSNRGGGRSNGGKSDRKKIPLFTCDRPTPRGCEEEDDKIFNKLTGKAKCVYDKLTEVSSDFKNMIKRFDGEFPVSHLKFEESSTLSSRTNAETSPPSNFTITIKINSNNLNRPNLSIARTIIHETIHAEMFRKILSILNNGGDLNGLTRSQWFNRLTNGDYPGIFDYYSRYGVNGMQHQQMAAHYISTISDYLKQFQPGLSQQIYDSLAWTGLKNTTAWNSLSPAQRASITNTTNSFNSQGSENCN